GVSEDGPGDAAVVMPVLGSLRGLVVGCGINVHAGDLDPYRMAALAIDEAVRNVVAVGADPSRIALLDNFCWGRTDRPETLRLLGQTGGTVPMPNLAGAVVLFTRLSLAINGGLVRACHDLSEGGLAVALAEMAFAGGVGADVTGGGELPDALRLFAESPTRF